MMNKKYFILAGIAIMAMGFLCSDNAQAKYTDSKSLTIAVNIEKHYEVAFDANNGTGSMSNQRFKTGVAQKLTANTYTYSGHYFAGWNTEANGSGTAYADEAMISEDLTDVGNSVVRLYAQWEEDEMHTVFAIDGTCIFHGYDMEQNANAGQITGTDCTSAGVNWADGTHRYIDSGIKLYDSTNYEKDYEVGFTITAYDPDHQYKEPDDTDNQATFFNAKLENKDEYSPGVVIRKSNNRIEITETITKSGNTHEKKVGYASSTTPVKVVLTRTNGVVYYSINGGAFTKLQDINNTSDYFDVTAWFGAAAKDDGTPMRYIDATMTDIYIKVGDTGANTHTVSFDAGGVTADPSDVTLIGSNKVGNSLPSMPNYVDTPDDGRLYFIGWYSGANGTGDKYDEDSVISRDMTLYAFWNDELILCEAGGETHGDLRGCMDEAGAGGTVTLLEDMKVTNVIIASGEDIILDLNGHTLKDNGGGTKPVIENNGKLTVMNGTITSSQRAGVLNNNGNGEMHIGSGARIIATGTRQAVYNNGGKLVISDDAYLSAATGERAAVQNLSNGELIINGGTIISAGGDAVKIESGTLTIGVQGGGIDKSTPILRGAAYGLNTSVNVSMYDGELMGGTAAINNSGRITAPEPGATAVGINPEATEVVDGVTYKVIYYE